MILPCVIEFQLANAYLRSSGRPTQDQMMLWERVSGWQGAVGALGLLRHLQTEVFSYWCYGGMTCCREHLRLQARER